jgi:hypothetical protein
VEAIAIAAAAAWRSGAVEGNGNKQVTAAGGGSGENRIESAAIWTRWGGRSSGGSDGEELRRI